MAGPLDGVRVLEFTQIWAGPIAGVHLSDLGAEVVKIEAPGGEPFRHSNAVVPGEAKMFHWLNRGKQSLVIDLKDERAQELIRRIVPGFDVVLTNYRAGVAERLHVDYETLSAVHPGLVYCRISGYGVRGPAANRAITDVGARAYAGVLASMDDVDEDGAPGTATAGGFADLTTGLTATMAICAALYRRQSSGTGQLVDASLLRSTLMLQNMAVGREPVSDATQRDPMIAEMERVRAEGGSYADLIEARKQFKPSPSLYSSAYLTADGPLVLACLTPANRNAARGVFAITDDPSEPPVEDAKAPDYVAKVAELKENIKAQMRERTSEEWMNILEVAGVPAAPVNFAEEMADDPHTIAEGVIVELDHEIVGKQRFVGPLVEMSESPPAAQGPSPTLGKHTDAVLTGGGVSAEEIAALRADGVLA